MPSAPSQSAMGSTRRHHSKPFPKTSFLFNILFLMAFRGQNTADALTQSLCSSDNTGSDSEPTQQQFQSLGACHDTCNSKNAAFAIVQDSNCWCSNIAPADTVSTSQCNNVCPGYGFENCGNIGSGLFGYLALGPSPSGTAGSGASPSTLPATLRSSTTVVRSTRTTSQPANQTLSIASTASIASSSSSSKVSSHPPTQPVATSTFTVSGAVVTQTLAPTTTEIAAATSLELSQKQSHSSSGTSAGTIAGAVIGSLAGVALLAGAAFFLWRRHRKNEYGESNDESKINRNTSTMSKAGLMASTRSADPERDGGSSPAMQQRRSFSPHTTQPPAAFIGGPRQRRDSQPLVYDQRLNPEALMQNWESNGSRTSVNTMHDQRDYSRPLKVSNPDIET